MTKRSYTPKEATTQKQVVSLLRTEFPEVVFFVNPFSELKLSGMSQKYIYALMREMKAQGWERGIPDLHIAAPGRGYTSLSIEFKRTEKDIPTYYMPRKKCLQIVNTDSKGQFSDKVQHLREQAQKLHHISEYGGLALFEYSYPKVKDLIHWYFGKGRHDFSIELATEFKMPKKYIGFEKVNIWKAESV